MRRQRSIAAAVLVEKAGFTCISANSNFSVEALHGVAHLGMNSWLIQRNNKRNKVNIHG
jgi:hypothetical protein